MNKCRKQSNFVSVSRGLNSGLIGIAARYCLIRLETACRIGPCQIMGAALDALAPRFPATKFLRIVSTDCIPGYPDGNLPTVLLYHGGKCLTTLVGLMPYGGRSTTPERAPLQPSTRASLPRPARGACLSRTIQLSTVVLHPRASGLHQASCACGGGLHCFSAVKACLMCIHASNHKQIYLSMPAMLTLLGSTHTCGCASYWLM